MSRPEIEVTIGRLVALIHNLVDLRFAEWTPPHVAQDAAGQIETVEETIKLLRELHKRIEA